MPCPHIVVLHSHTSTHTLKHELHMMYSYQTDNDCLDKKAKGTKKYGVNRKIKFEDYKTCLEKNETMLKM